MEGMAAGPGESHGGGVQGLFGLAAGCSIVVTQHWGRQRICRLASFDLLSQVVQDGGVLCRVCLFLF
jgi:hypothetical protein